MMKYNMSDDYNLIDSIIKKCLFRNLNGLEINGENTLKKHIKDINFYEFNLIDLIKDNIISNESRHLLLIS